MAPNIVTFVLAFLSIYSLLQQVHCITSIYDPDEDKVVKFFREEDQQGEHTTVYWHNPKIYQEWTSLTQSGVWVYYSDDNYTGNNVTVVFGEDVSINLFQPLKSVRYAGGSRSSTQPTALLYKDTWFRGTEYYVEVEDSDDLVMVPNFRDMGTEAKSMILLGDAFTTFPKQNFRGGRCWCLRPTHFAMTSGPDNEMLKASFYPDLTDIGPVGSLMLTCDDVPMAPLCNSLPDQDINRSRCPVLTNGRVRYCQ